jgi:hypothetical protein
MRICFIVHNEDNVAPRRIKQTPSQLKDMWRNRGTVIFLYTSEPSQWTRGKGPCLNDGNLKNKTIIGAYDRIVKQRSRPDYLVPSESIRNV